MKTRQGFVSNSSSSSFIIGLDENYSKDLMREKLFDNNQSVRYEFSWGEDEWLSVETLLEWIDDEFTEENQIQTFEDFRNAYSLEYGEGPAMPENTHKLPMDERREVWAKYEQDCQKYVEKRCLQIWPLYKEYAESGNLYNVSFADDDGKMGSHLEHGVLWTDVFTGIRFSHH